MPTYAYVCGKCNHTFEAFQGIKARPLRQCPACGQSALKRLIGTGAGIIFKGSGFYCTDYRSDGYRTAAKSETGSTKSDTAKPTDAKSETKSGSAPASQEPKKKTA
ncbi:MAG: zinc ribbon domain-containing protein [Planctomycetes bacterium]|jgi:putative FmdB family regulatory protein|nr:zinc ribbon domain-containing protein [Planctomycetota bacterium]